MLHLSCPVLSDLPCFFYSPYQWLFLADFLSKEEFPPTLLMAYMAIDLFPHLFSRTLKISSAVLYVDNQRSFNNASSILFSSWTFLTSADPDGSPCFWRFSNPSSICDFPSYCHRKLEVLLVLSSQYSVTDYCKFTFNFSSIFLYFIETVVTVYKFYVLFLFYFLKRCQSGLPLDIL